MSKRAKVEKAILDFLDLWVPNTGNRELYIEKFKKMSDKQFQKMMEDFREGKDVLRAVVPNFRKAKITVEHNFNVAKTINHDFLEQCWLTSDKTGIEYLTPQKYMVVSLPLRRQSQLLTKKIAIPKDNNSVDLLTGQPTRGSKGSAITAPEAQILNSLGLESTLTELMSIRGGNRAAMDAFDQSIYLTGVGDDVAAANAGGTAKSNETFAMYLRGMHISNTVT